MDNIITEFGKKCQVSGGLLSTCGSQHIWIWAGDPNYLLPEGFPCACGQMLWHIEKCKECGQDIIRPQAR